MKRSKYLCKFYILLIGLNLGIKPIKAQMVAQDQFPTTTSSPLAPGLYPPRKTNVKLPSTVSREKESLRSNKSIKVEKIEFKGNTVFRDEELEGLVKSYLGKRLIFEQLLEIRSLITKYYNEAGYVTSFAFLGIPNNQRIGSSKGVVTIQIVEGKLEQIKISGGSRLEGYIRSRLKKATSPVLNRVRLEESLRLLQTDTNIERISGELKETSEPGKTVLRVKVKVSQPIRISVVGDNSRSPSIGSFQRGLQVKHSNVFGLGDWLGLDYRNTEGSNGYSLRYSVPMNGGNGNIDFSYTNISSKVIEEPFNELDIVNSVRSYQIGFSQTVISNWSEDSTQEFILGLRGERVESKSSLLGDGFPLSEGADEEGRTRISVLRFSQDWISRKENTAFQLRSQFSIGTGALGATTNDKKADSRFLAWRGQGVWLQRLGKTTFLLRGDLQLSSNKLLALEQINLGGVSTVRGYRYSTYLSDNGLLLGAELRIPVFNKRNRELKVIPFVDFGHSWNNSRKNDERIAPLELGSLLSVGLGVEYKIDSKLSARLDWGIPLIKENTNDNSNTWQEKGIHLSVRYQPF